MTRSRTFDEQEVLEKAMKLFWRQGYERTSMEDLFKVMQISRQSLYNTFGNKRMLFEAALQRYNDLYMDAALAPMETPEAGTREIRNYLAMFANSLIEQTERKGCLYANTTAELAVLDELAAMRMGDYFLRISKAFENALANEMDRGWDPEKEIEAMVPLLVSTSYGLSTMAKAGATAAYLTLAAESAASVLN